ncbi:hypothetical protein MXM81_22495 [Serratia plymuthica]|uniref:hypothetical protein n=1 Tax=Serratia plymuthica TaxID=82996 RepID=UPI002DBD161F|nr:hypothetical protein [Serratia plymuthica]MEB6541845.1 hypothetical protein [Serratia plymuthica]
MSKRFLGDEIDKNWRSANEKGRAGSAVDIRILPIGEQEDFTRQGNAISSQIARLPPRRPIGGHFGYNQG